ncbi:MAG: hypothetical protein HQL97_03060 [Magnetococcales bacterium]|nr:hypothetical protein [Magnetococcales bacterium]
MMKKRWMGMMGVVIGLGVAGAAWAAGDVAAKEPVKGDKVAQFKARKAREIQDLEARLTCVKSSNTPAEMKQCHETIKARHQSEQLQRIQEQRRKLDEREKSLREQQSTQER